MKKGEVISNLFDSTSQITTISDLKDDYFDGMNLQNDQKVALTTFDKHRIQTLSEAQNEIDFKKKYFLLQVEENTKDYRLFLC